MAGSTIGFDTSGVKIHPSLLQEYHKHQRGVNQGLKQGLHQTEGRLRQRTIHKSQVKKTKNKST